MSLWGIRVGLALLALALVLGALSFTNPAAVDGWTVGAFFSAVLGVLVIEFETSPVMDETGTREL